MGVEAGEAPEDLVRGHMGPGVGSCHFCPLPDSDSPFQSGQFNEDMIPTVGFNMRKITKGNVTIKVRGRGALEGPPSEQMTAGDRDGAPTVEELWGRGSGAPTPEELGRVGESPAGPGAARR